tara:strand:- start:443 stop:610 length:168 start_codon:yes stop_codon:yes gene_type:complete
MRADNNLDHIDDNNLDRCERFIGGRNWSVEVVAPQAVLHLIPEWERKIGGKFPFL